MTKKTISLKHIYKSFDNKCLLSAISKSFSAPYSYALTGKSGSGKSTLLHIMAGLDTPTQGEVLFNDHNIYTLSNNTRATLINNFIGIVFQKPYLIKELSLLENIMLPGIIAGKSINECKDRAHLLLNLIQLEQKITLHPMSLSGGEQQRIALARALFNKPAFLLADEPTGNLDRHTGNAIIDLIRSYQTDCNMGVIINTHDTHIASHMDYQYILENGTLYPLTNQDNTKNNQLPYHI